MAQRYSDPAAIERLRAHLCPECAGTVNSHTDDNRFWVPRGNDCSLRPDGVLDRIAEQRRIDSALPEPAPNRDGDAPHAHPAERRNLSTCTACGAPVFYDDTDGGGAGIWNHIDGGRYLCGEAG